jgi:regulator of sigma E protease
MQSFPTTIVAFIFVLGVLVFVHEFGHYAVAKLFKVRVEVFSLGFGKRLLGFRRGDTDYRISLLPLGGYVKMAGENPMETRTGDPGEFMSHPRWQRFLIAIAGPVMNIILAVVVLTGLFMYRHEYEAYLDKPAEIGWVTDGSTAQNAGFRTGDKIISIHNKQNPTWDDVRFQIFGSIDQNLEMDVLRGAQTLHVTLPVHISEKDDTNLFTELGMIPAQPTIVGDVVPGEPAEKAGIQPKDQIIAVNGTNIQSGGYDALFELLQKGKGTPAQITLERSGQRLEKTLVPQYLAGSNSKGNDKAYRLGVLVKFDINTEKLRFPAAFHAAVVQNKRYSTLIFKVLSDLLTGKGSLKNLGGPVEIARQSGRAAQLGFIALLDFMCLISMNLAIFNLLPIPILDGGLMLMLLVESVMRRDIKQQVKERVYQAAFVFLVLFAAVVIYNDVARTIPSHPTSSQNK